MEPKHCPPHAVEGERTILEVLQPLKNILGRQVSLALGINGKLHLQIQDHAIQVHWALETLRATIAEHAVHQHVTILDRLIHEGIDQLSILRPRHREHRGPI